jgi:hypothetical protein
MIVNKVVSLKLKIGISRSKRLVKLLWLVQSTWEFCWKFSKRRKYDTSQMWKSS